LFELARERFARARNPHDEALMWSNLGDCYRKRNCLDEAVIAGRESLRRLRAVLGFEHLDVADSLDNLALSLEDKGSYAEAEQLHREALAVR
jgi:serine/threonine-protein kinase